MRAGIAAESGIASYDAARWDDWVPQLDCVRSAGPLATLRQLVPHNASGENETHVGAFPANALIFFFGKPRRVQCQMDGREFDLQCGPGTAMLLPGCIESFWLSTPESAHNVFHLHLDDGFCRTLLTQEGLSATFAPNAEIKDPFLTATAEALLESLLGPAEPTRLYWETTATSVVLRLAHLSRRNHAPPRYGADCDWRIRRSIEEIEARLHEDLGLIELAAAVGLSSSHYAGLFRAATGMPPHAWLVKRRIGRACELLMSPRISITDIAFALGFPSSQHFATTFRKHIGATPSEWRRARML